jgi:hypothetical protein
MKALALIEHSGLPLSDIAKEVGWTKDTLYDLYEGNIQKTGPIGELFQSELSKIAERRVGKISQLMKDNKDLCLRKFNEYLRMTKGSKPSPSVLKTTNAIMNCLNKASPGLSIGKLSYSYTKGLSAEDLINEFKRLKSIAASDDRGISETIPNRAGEVYRASERGNQSEEVSEAPFLQAEPEDGTFPYESGTDTGDIRRE